MTQECATPVESAIVLWYWFDADINTSTGDEDDPRGAEMFEAHPELLNRQNSG
jgi:hypothetical protein